MFVPLPVAVVVYDIGSRKSFENVPVGISIISAIISYLFIFLLLFPAILRKCSGGWEYEMIAEIIVIINLRDAV